MSRPVRLARLSVGAGGLDPRLLVLLAATLWGTTGTARALGPDDASPTAVIYAHNHPSGDPSPSSADIALTADIVQCGKLLDIAVLDHVVIGHGRWVSMKRLGLGFGTSG